VLRPRGNDLWPRPRSQCGLNRAARWIHSGPENETRACTRRSIGARGGSPSPGAFAPTSQSELRASRPRKGGARCLSVRFARAKSGATNGVHKGKLLEIASLAGQIRHGLVQYCQRKYIASRLPQITPTTPAIPHPQEGRIAIVTDVGRGRRWTRQHRARA
jgi:hypothetical protein